MKNAKHCPTEDPKSRKTIVKFDQGMIPQHPMQARVKDQEEVKSRLKQVGLHIPHDECKQRNVSSCENAVGGPIAYRQQSEEEAPFMLLNSIQFMNE